VNSPADAIKPSVIDTVLVIDDEVLIRISIAQYLRDCGYRVLEAANADEAVTILQKPDIQVDVVLCDVEMPGSMNGFGFMKWRANFVLADRDPCRHGRARCQCSGRAMRGWPDAHEPYDPKIVLDYIKQLLAAVRVGRD